MDPAKEFACKSKKTTFSDIRGSPPPKLLSFINMISEFSVTFDKSALMLLWDMLIYVILATNLQNVSPSTDETLELGNSRYSNDLCVCIHAGNLGPRIV